MSDEEENVTSINKEDKTTNGVEGILKQIGSELNKTAANKFREGAKAILLKKQEHERSIVSLNAELDQLKSKFKAGLL